MTKRKIFILITLLLFNIGVIACDADDDGALEENGVEAVEEEPLEEDVEVDE